jgi:predicted DsbA family dithiol-disulfide isomerase
MTSPFAAVTSPETPTKLSLEVFSDFICPWCYIGHRRLTLAREALGGELAVDVRWLPFELNPGMHVGGYDRREYRSAKFGSWEQSQRLDAGTVEAGAPDGVEFRYDLMTRTPNTMAAHQLVWSARDTERQDDLVQRLFRAYFTEGRDISERAVLAELAQAAGLPSGYAADAWDDEQASAGVREQEARAHSVGLRGVPHYVLGGHYGFSGAVPTEELVRLLRQVAAQSQASS